MMVKLDQNAACTGAIQKVFPTEVISLHDWHLHKNQVRNIQEWRRKVKRESWSKTMNTDFHILRQCSIEEESICKREQVERKYFMRLYQDGIISCIGPSQNYASFFIEIEERQEDFCVKEVATQNVVNPNLKGWS